MKKLITLIAVISLISGTSLVFANGGGEGNNTGCNGQGNENSPCAGTTNNGGNVGNIKNNSKAKAVSKNKLTNKQSQSADNQVSVNNTVEGDKITTIIPPATTPMVGTFSGQVTTPFGGAGISKDAQYMILNFKMNKLKWAEQEGYITVEERLKHGKKLFKKFIRANNNNPLR